MSGPRPLMSVVLGTLQEPYHKNSGFMPRMFLGRRGLGSRV